MFSGVWESRASVKKSRLLVLLSRVSSAVSFEKWSFYGGTKSRQI